MVDRKEAYEMHSSDHLNRNSKHRKNDSPGTIAQFRGNYSEARATTAQQHVVSGDDGKSEKEDNKQAHEQNVTLPCFGV